MSNNTKLFTTFIITGIISFAIFWFINPRGVVYIQQEKISIKTNIKQVLIDRPVYIKESYTDDIKTLLSELNIYRTTPGWIAISNSKINAGIYKRVWNTKYKVKYPDHEIGFLFGTGAGVYYRFRLWKTFTIGVNAGFQNKEAIILFSGGYQL